MSKLFFLAVLFLFLFACQKNVTGPGANLPTSGIKGFVVNEDGQPLNNVKIYCTYSYGYFPYAGYTLKKTITKTTHDSAYTFRFVGNFPNPVFRFAFFRFSLGRDSRVKLKMTSRYQEKTFVLLDQSFEYGDYQFFIPNFVDSLNLRNGFYDVEFAASFGDSTFRQTVPLVVISRLGKPNAISNSNGFYAFDYRESFQGDSIVPRILDYGIGQKFPIREKIYFYVEKSGYEPQFFLIRLIPNALLSYDLVLTKIKEQ